MGRDEPGRLPTPASPRTRGAGLPRRTNPPAPTSPPSHPPRPRLLGETSGRAAVDIMRTPLDRHVLPLPSFGRTPARPVSAPTPHSRARRMYRRLPPPRAIRAGAHRATAAASLAADVGGRAGTPRRRQTRARVPRAPLSGGPPRRSAPPPAELQDTVPPFPQPSSTTRQQPTRQGGTAANAAGGWPTTSPSAQRRGGVRGRSAHPIRAAAAVANRHAAHPLATPPLRTTQHPKNGSHLVYCPSCGRPRQPSSRPFPFPPRARVVATNSRDAATSPPSRPARSVPQTPPASAASGRTGPRRSPPGAARRERRP